MMGKHEQHKAPHPNDTHTGTPMTHSGTPMTAGPWPNAFRL